MARQSLISHVLFASIYIAIIARPTFLVTGLLLDLTNLTAYWQFDGNLKNTVTNVSLFNQHGASLVAVNRLFHTTTTFAFNINGGYAQIPRGVHFSRKSFSILFWLYITKSNCGWQDILVVQNGALNDFFALSINTNNSMMFPTNIHFSYGLNTHTSSYGSTFCPTQLSNSGHMWPSRSTATRPRCGCIATGRNSFSRAAYSTQSTATSCIRTTFLAEHSVHCTPISTKSCSSIDILNRRRFLRP